MLTGSLPPSEGVARVEGIDVNRHPTRARRRIGVVPEEASVYADLSMRQNVLLMGELHGVARAAVREQRCDEPLRRFHLAERAGQKGRQLSKGLRQRVMLCMALVNDSAILFLGEPTSGLDVASARLIREVIARLNRERGTTVFLTTHNMADAAVLCRRVGIPCQGRLVAIDTQAALRGLVASRRSVAVSFHGSVPDPATVLPARDLEVEPLPADWRVYAAEPGALAQHIAVRCAALGRELESLNTVEPLLEDVFVSITGAADAPR